MRRPDHYAIAPACLALLSGLALAPAHATRCSDFSVEGRYERATAVYEARLMLTEYVRDTSADDLSDEARQEAMANDAYRFVLAVDEVFKGTPPPRVEKRQPVNGVEVLDSASRLLKDLRVGRSVILFEPFEPGHTTHCNGSIAASAPEADAIRQALRALRDR